MKKNSLTLKRPGLDAESILENPLSYIYKLSQTLINNSSHTNCLFFYSLAIISISCSFNLFNRATICCIVLVAENNESTYIFA